MKNKLLKIAFCFMLFSTLLITASFAATVKEEVADYTSGAYIIGSTRFEPNVIITASLAANAGVNEAKANLALGKDISNLKVSIYSYDSDFEEWNEVKEDGTTRLLETSEAEKLESNLNIFFVNNEEKVLEVSYDGNVDTTSISNNVKYEDGKFLVPATTFSFKFSETKEISGEKVVVASEVSTNVDKNVTTGTEAKPEVDTVSENYVAKVGSEYFKDLDSAIAKATTENKVVLINDVELSKQIVVTKAVTLDFNGKVVTVAEDLEDISAILVLKGGDLVITGNGTLNAASQGNDYSIAVWAKETGKVTIKNGTFTNAGAKSKNDAGKENNNEMIYVSGSGVITIEDGTFIGNTENEKWGTRYTLNAHDTSYKEGTAKIIVKGGTYTNFNPANNLAEGEGTNFVAAGYKVTVSGNEYTVVEDV